MFCTSILTGTSQDGYIYIYTYTCVRIHIYIYTSMYMYIHVFTCRCVCYLPILMYIFTVILTYIYIYTYTCGTETLWVRLRIPAVSLLSGGPNYDEMIFVGTWTKDLQRCAYRATMSCIHIYTYVYVHV